MRFHHAGQIVVIVGAWMPLASGACSTGSRFHPPTARLEGVVIGQDSVPIAGASVLLTDWIATTDSLGRYSATLQAGRHVVRIHSNRLAWHHDTLELVPGATYRHDVSLAIASPGWVRGTVRGADGLPLPATQVVMVGTAVNALTDSAGGFRFVAPTGQATIGAARRGYRMARTEVEVSSRQTTQVELRLERCAERADTC